MEEKILKGSDEIALVKTRKRKVKPFHNIGFDTEDDSKGNVHLLCFYSDEKTSFTFFDSDEAIFWLIFSRFDIQQVLLWAVNTEYDVNNLMHCTDYQYLFNRIYNKGRFILGTMPFNPQIRFYDLINFYSLSAEKVGQLFGLKKYEFDFTSRKYDKTGKVIVSKKEIRYCMQDAKIAKIGGDFITEKFGEYDIAQAATVASCSLQIYFNRFSPYTPSSRSFAQCVPDLISNCYKGYFGGRVECFRYGVAKGKLKYYDINSLYPFVMQQNLFPHPEGRIEKKRTLDIDYGIVSCSVTVPKNTYLPVLPIRYKGKLIFPVGTFSGVWTIPEIQFALQQGVKVNKVFWSYDWEGGIDLFSSFVNHFYQERLRSKNDADKHFFKVVMNSLYGKFAEKRRYTKYVDISEGSIFDPIIFGKCQVTEETIPQHTNVIVSAYVTSYGRLELWKLMKKILDNNCEILYCDTDSVIYSGDFKLPDEKGLGKVKMESQIKQAEFLGAKYYRYEDNAGNWHFVCKGVPKQNQKDMFEKGQSTYRKPIRYRESLRRNISANIWIETTKHSVSDYDKRLVLQDGSTKPITLNQLKQEEV